MPPNYVQYTVAPCMYSVDHDQFLTTEKFHSKLGQYSIVLFHRYGCNGDLSIFNRKFDKLLTRQFSCKIVC